VPREPRPLESGPARRLESGRSSPARAPAARVRPREPRPLESGSSPAARATAAAAWRAPGRRGRGSRLVAAPTPARRAGRAV